MLELFPGGFEEVDQTAASSSSPTPTPAAGSGSGRHSAERSNDVENGLGGALA